MPDTRKVFQFHVSLEDIEPEIWRRIQISGDSTFWDLHCAIQDAFGWLDSHLHEFHLGSGDDELRVGSPDEEYPSGGKDSEVLPGWEVPVEENLEEGEAFLYVYDFGDDWMHHITFERVSEAVPGRKYPICLDGPGAPVRPRIVEEPAVIWSF